MPVRLRITLWFGVIVFTILFLVCGSVYYFSNTNRVHNIRTRLTNRAITTGRLLQQSDVFDLRLLQRIDASTELAMKNKVLQVYDYLNAIIYNYSERKNDTLRVPVEILDEARIRNSVFFGVDSMEAVAYHYVDENTRIIIVAAGVDEDGIAKLRQLRIILVVSFVAGVIITFFAGYIFSRRILRPVQKIADDINEISTQNLTRRIGTRETADEWNYLSNTMNELLNRLQEGFEMQRRFIANASHELSTPLTSISSQLEVFLQKQRDVQQYQHVMESVLQDVRHLSKLTQTLLEFAQASGNHGGINIEPIRVDELLMRIPAEIRKIDPDFAVILFFDNLPEEENELVISGNSELLFSAIKNIVTNACKYSHDKKAIVRLEAGHGSVIICVQDKGVGIPEKDIRFIFQPFYRVDSSQGNGFGLGLSLAHRIIRLHNGEISVDSTVGEGTEFKIILPVETSNRFLIHN
jgi:two-component system, OmpR family, sensor histidine kinase ArlS